MWKNFFHVAFRNIGKNQVFSMINMAGLTIGLASAIIIILFISLEVSYDRFHDRSDDIYRTYLDGKIGDQTFRGAWSSYVLGPAAQKEIEEIEEYVRLEVFPQQLIWHGDERQIEDNVIFADSTFFRVFSFNLIYGNPDNVLSNPNSVVITRKKALQYFGTENPIGQTLEFNSNENYYVVTGVMEEFPENSHFFCDFLLSMSNIEASRSENWLSNSIYTYFLLEPGTDYRDVEVKINQLLLKNIKPELEELLDVNPEEWLEGGNVYGIYLQSLTNIHLNPDIEYGEERCFRPVNDRTYIYIFALIAFFILLIASINFMNLATARSAVRSREIAMRKVVGSQRRTLIFQFLLESMFLTLIALVFALLIVELTLPKFNQAMGMSLHFDTLGRGIVLGGVLLLTLILGFISGIYPAFYLSSYEPLHGLMGGSLRGRRSIIFRSMMVVLQFTISVAIIVGTLIITRQVNFLVNMDHGFDDEQIIVIDRVFPMEGKIPVFCEEVAKIPGVVKASSSSTYLGFSNVSSTFQIKGRERSSSFMFDINNVDPNFFETYGLSLWKGKGSFFSKNDQSDTMTVIINKTAVEEYNLDDPLNTVIQAPAYDGGMNNYRIIGVVDDFHHSSLRKVITPYLFGYKTPSEQGGYISIRLKKGLSYTNPTIKRINKLWSEMTGGEPFQFFYLDDELDKYYREEKRTGRISMVFSIIAIIIACLGLLGLTIFNTERRLKEIAVRKALGAGIYDLLMIISREILILLGISIGIAWVIAFFFMKNWLQVFPYNIGFTPGLYVIAALVAVTVTMITVNAITFRAASSNPADTLYHE